MGDSTERVLVAGASGRTGQELLSVLRPTDITVRGTTRSHADADELERLGADEVAVVDLFEPADAVRAVEGCEVVLCALGTPPGPRHFLGGRLVDRDGVHNLLTAAIATDADHFVLESAIGVGSSKPGRSLPTRLLIRGSLSAKRDAERALRRSSLEYTILRPGRLTNAPPTDSVLVGEGGDSVTGSIPRADVAHLMAAAPYTPEAVDRTFEVASRDGVDGRPRNLVRIEWNGDRVGIEPEQLQP